MLNTAHVVKFLQARMLNMACVVKSSFARARLSLCPHTAT